MQKQDGFLAVLPEPDPLHFTGTGSSKDTSSLDHCNGTGSSKDKSSFLESNRLIFDLEKRKI
jgi:hypothetical protein